MSSENVVIKGSKNGVVIYIEGSDEWKKITDEICEALSEIKDLFLYNSILTIVSKEPLTLAARIEAQQKICAVLDREADIVFETGTAGSLKKRDDEFYFGNLRGGQQKCCSGNLCIVGDVNPGAELRAGGNIVVLGTLKGKAYAGMSGDRSAVIAAMNFDATQIAIADIICRAPESGYPIDRGGEIAFIRDGRICIDSYMSKKLTY